MIGTSLLIVAIVAGFNALVFLTPQNQPSPVLNYPSTIAVSGLVSIQGVYAIVFACLTLPDSICIQHSAGLIKRSYSLDLPNQHNYAVRVVWTNTRGTIGSSYCGTIGFNQTIPFYRYDIDDLLCH